MILTMKMLLILENIVKYLLKNCFLELKKVLLVLCENIIKYLLIMLLRLILWFSARFAMPEQRS